MLARMPHPYGEAEARTAKRLDRLAQPLDIGDGLLLRALDRHVARIEPGLADHRRDLHD